MTRFLFVVVGTAVALLASTRIAQAHCEVPCGIYTDQLRFEQMLEDQTTIAKATAQINELAKKEDAVSRNQLVRWVNTKETHATHTQHVVAQYFLTQRIKPGTDEATNKAYVRKLVAAHAVMQAAMKCKQTIDPAAAETLKKAIHNLYRAYEGNEPALHKKGS